MVKIRLRRMGAKKRPFYRIVVADSRTPRDGRFIEMVGTYDPNSDPPTINLKRDRIEYWLSSGALPTDTARGLLKSQGFLGGKPVEEKPESKKRTKATKKAEAAAETAAEAPAEPAAEASAEPAAE